MSNNNNEESSRYPRNLDPESFLRQTSSPSGENQQQNPLVYNNNNNNLPGSIPSPNNKNNKRITEPLASPSSSMSSPNDPDHDQQLARLRRFYQHYDPGRVPHAEITLRTWRGSYNVMWSKLTQKYGPEPDAGAASGNSISALAAATMAAQKLSPHRNRGLASGSPSPSAYAGRSNINYRARLQRFYAKYAPHRLPTVDKALEIFRGKEESLFESLRRKFGPEPDEDYPIPEVADMISGMDQPTASLQMLAGADNSNPASNRKSSYPRGGDYGNTNNNNNAAASSSTAAPYPGAPSAAQIAPMESTYNTDTQPSNARGKPVPLSTFGTTLNGNDDGDGSSNKQPPSPPSEPIDWENMCACCDECTDTLRDCLRSRGMERFFKWFYPVAFACAIIGAIVTALILVGVDRNIVVFKQTKSTSELDLSQLYGPGLYEWGVNTRGIEFPTTLKKITVFKDVVCCGGQNIFLGKTFFWTIRDQEAGNEVNLTELADMILTFGGLPEDKIVVQAEESFSDSIAEWSQNMSLDEFVSNRTAIEDAAHTGLVAELRRNKIYVAVPRRYFNLGLIVTPATYNTQKIQVFQNAQEIITAGYREQATTYRLTTTQLIRDIEANTTLIKNEANVNASRLKDIAVSTNAAKDLQNIANAVAQMSLRVNAASDAAAINLFRLNELIDIVEENRDTQFFVNLANGDTAFPLI